MPVVIPSHEPASVLRRLLPPLIVTAITAIAALLRVLKVPHYYYWDDTQNGAYGQWWELGNRVLEGEWSLLNPHVWQAGNYLAEGQWGLLSPLSILIAIGTQFVDSAVVYASLVKIVFLCAMAVGVYLLARSFGASPAWAGLAGVAAPLAGFTSYMDAPSWFSGLVNSALLPYAWWALRRLVSQRRSPLLFVALSYLIVSSGYLTGVFILAVAIAATILDRWIARDARGALSALAAGVLAGLFTVLVFIPGVLTAPVTDRAGFEIVNDRFLSADISDLLAAGNPLARVSIDGYWGVFALAPLQYVAWFLPLLPLLLPVARRKLRPLLPVFVVLVFALALVLGPSEIGPLRYFLRYMPYIAVCSIVIFAVLATVGLRRVTRRRAGWAVAVVAVTSWFAWSEFPGAARNIAVVAVIQIAVVVGLWAWHARTRREDAGASPLVPAVFALVTVALVIPQTVVFPTSPVGDFRVPTAASEMQLVLDDAQGDGIVVGDVYGLGELPGAYEEALIANLWYLAEPNVMNTYTVLPFSAFSDDVCMDLRGSTCRRLFDRLFAADDATGLPLADLLALNTVLVLNHSFDDALPDAPAGWAIAERGEHTVRYERDAPVPTAGGPVWESPGVSTTVLAQDDTSVTLRVDEVAASGGRVVLSRLAWPGYAVGGGGELGEPLRDYLLTVEFEPGDRGSTVTVEFVPPGFVPGLIATGASGLITILWAVWVFALRFRRQDPSSHEDTSQPLTGPGVPA